MADETKKSGVMAQIFVGIAVAVCVGGSSPWWLKELKEAFGGTPPNQPIQTQAAETKPERNDYLANIDKSDRNEKQILLETELEELKRKQRTTVQEPEVRRQTNVAGEWEGGGSTYQFYQNGSTITLEEFTAPYGRTAVGEGTIIGNEVTLSVLTLNGSLGTLRMTLSDGGRQLSGTYTDHLTQEETQHTITR